MRMRIDGARVIEKPWVRTQLLVLYGFVVLHKLNSDFFDPTTSCAAVHSNALVEALGIGSVRMSGAGGNGQQTGGVPPATPQGPATAAPRSRRARRCSALWPARPSISSKCRTKCPRRYPRGSGKN